MELDPRTRSSDGIPALPDGAPNPPVNPDIQPVAASRNSRWDLPKFSASQEPPSFQLSPPQQGAASLQSEEWKAGERGGEKKIMNINLNSSEFKLGRVRAPQIFEQCYCKQGGKSRSVTLTHKYAQKINFVLAVHATFTAIPLLIPGPAEGEEAVNGINIPI